MFLLMEYMILIVSRKVFLDYDFDTIHGKYIEKNQEEPSTEEQLQQQIQELEQEIDLLTSQ